MHGSAKIIVFFNTTSQNPFMQASFGTRPCIQVIGSWSYTTKLLKPHAATSLNAFVGHTLEFSSPQTCLLVEWLIPMSLMSCNQDTYIHRLGRTARAGKSGKGIFVLLQDEVQSCIRKRELRLIDILNNRQLKKCWMEMTIPLQLRVDTRWLSRVLKDVDTMKKAEDCYRSLLGFFMQHLKRLGNQRPANEVIRSINMFTTHAGLKQRPGISSKILEQFGCMGHPDVSFRETGFDGNRGSSLGRYRGNGFESWPKGGVKTNTGGSHGRKSGKDGYDDFY